MKNHSFFKELQLCHNGLFRGMDDQIFKNQYTLERMIVWLINPLEFNLRQFDPWKKNDTWKIFESATPKKVNSAHLPPGKIYLDRNPWKKLQSRDPLVFYPCMDKKWNSPIIFTSLHLYLVGSIQIHSGLLSILLEISVLFLLLCFIFKKKDPPTMACFPPNVALNFQHAVVQNYF